ncbi:type 4a pilus biogenesis protein PilO [Methylobacillus arboreus]|uniref:type 4a pilus biogenesis protein PilO n=1 Tax=Methylobacillus arboreus TaxID=755170 RepID=UPI001E5A0BAB|nr:type 4a pilus biogenesis protein PilO [Methylobacillus arboreus]MCB5189330.1 type 4a pilus biogenesis protein PilO [Methylobacillus arboreus]
MDTAVSGRKMDRLRYGLNRLGWQGKLGLLLLAACMAIALAYAWPQARSLKQLKLDVTAMHRAIPQHQGQWIDRSPQASLNTFYQFLPPEGEATGLLSQILLMAEQHGLIPEKVDYSLIRHPAAAYSRYQLSLPVQGSYVEIRRFIAAVLTSLPSAALNEVSLRREDVLSDHVEARLKFTLYLHKDGQ